ncbi:MAG: hypothetical protein LBR38_09985 [Synergistaceae bacterium]|nr:hypothetical protein [Synergistaceae bacterium]
MTVREIFDKVKRAVFSVGEWLWLFVVASFLEKRTFAIRKEAWDMNDNVMLLLFGDFLGLPNPISYYTLEILPYIAEDMPAWQRRIMNRKSVAAEKAAQYDFT